jgi:hypothetical protein
MVSFSEDINTLKVCLCSYSSNISFNEKKGIFCKWTLMYNVYSIAIWSVCFKWFIGYTEKYHSTPNIWCVGDNIRIYYKLCEHKVCKRVFKYH